MDTPRECLVDQAMPFRRHHIAQDVPVDAGISVPHEQLPEHDPPVLCRRAAREERRTFMKPVGRIGFVLLGTKTPAAQPVRLLDESFR